MWLFTKRGFYSIVEDKQQPCQWQVRGRVLVDMENLVKVIGYQGKIIKTPKADYRYRIVINAEQLIKIMTTMAKDINYTNFKNEVSTRPDQAHKMAALHNVWHEMWNVQFDNIPQRQKRRRKGKAKAYVGESGNVHYSMF